MFILIISLVALLVIILIAFSVLQQKRRKVESEKRTEVSRLTIAIDETESILTQISTLPITKGLMMILHNRILETYRSIQAVNRDASLSNNINDRQTLIDSIAKTFKSQGLDTFRLPNDDRQVLQMVQILKKLKSIVNAEHKRGRIKPEVFNNEIKRIDLMQIRININSIVKRARAACDSKQTGSARTYLDKAIKTLKAINSEGDSFVSGKLAEAKEMLAQLDQVKIDRDEQKSQDRAHKSSTDLDMLFQPKKKW